MGLLPFHQNRGPVFLRGVAIFEATKGLLALAAGAGVLSFRHTDLHAAMEAFLVEHGVDPDRRIASWFLDSVAKLTSHAAWQIAAIACIYAVVRLAEAYGLWRDRSWAEWFAVISAGIYLPLELWHFAHHPRPFGAAVIVFNVAIIVYLALVLKSHKAQLAA